MDTLGHHQVSGGPYGASGPGGRGGRGGQSGRGGFGGRGGQSGRGGLGNRGGRGGYGGRGGGGPPAASGPSGHRVSKQSSAPRSCIYHPNVSSHNTEECRYPSGSSNRPYDPRVGPSNISQTPFGGVHRRSTSPPKDDNRGSPPTQPRGRGGFGAAMDQPQYHIRGASESPQASGQRKVYGAQPDSDGISIRGRANGDQTFRGGAPVFAPRAAVPSNPAYQAQQPIDQSKAIPGGPRNENGCETCGKRHPPPCWHKPAATAQEHSSDPKARLDARIKQLMSSESLGYYNAKKKAELELQPAGFGVREASVESVSSSGRNQNGQSLEQRMTGGPYRGQTSSNQSTYQQQAGTPPQDLLRTPPQQSQPLQQGFASPDVQMGGGYSVSRGVVVSPPQDYSQLQQDLLVCRTEIQNLQRQLADSQPLVSLPSPVDPFPMDTIERHLQTLQHAYCAICLCATPFALAGVTAGIHKHTELACQFYLTRGVPDGLETKFWAAYCPVFQGLLPYCDTCDKFGYFIDREHDALVAGAKRAPSDRMRLIDEAACTKKGEWCVGKGGLSAVTWCGCRGAARETGKSWRSYDAVQAEKDRRSALTGKARADPADAAAGPCNPLLQCQTPEGRVHAIENDEEL